MNMPEASIVFRNSDMSSTEKIYVDKMHAALELAAKFRNASFYVDIITPQDEVAYRWLNGAVEWDQYDRAAQASEREPYDFVRQNDLSWDAKSRLVFLHDALDYALDVVEGQENSAALSSFENLEDCHGVQAWPLIHDAHIIASKGGSVEVCDLTSSSDYLFLPHWLEHIALCIHTGLWLDQTRQMTRRIVGA